MAATHTWKIPQVERLTDTNTIRTIHWELVSTELSNSVRSYGTLKFTGIQDIPWGSLIESNVYDYLVAELGGQSVIDDFQAKHQSKLNALNTPSTAFGLPPSF